MYIVAQQYTDKERSKVNLMSEQIHPTLDAALTDYNDRIMSGHRDLIVARILQVKTVIVDFDVAGTRETPLNRS